MKWDEYNFFVMQQIAYVFMHMETLLKDFGKTVQTSLTAHLQMTSVSGWYLF